MHIRCLKNCLRRRGVTLRIRCLKSCLRRRGGTLCIRCVFGCSRNINEGKVRQPPHTLKKFYQFFTVGMSVGLVYMVSSAAGMCTCTCTGIMTKDLTSLRWFFDSVINLQFEVFKIQNLWFLINSNNCKH